MTTPPIPTFNAPVGTGFPAPTTFEPKSPFLTVRFGQKTFDAEGREEPGPYFSRLPHVPGTVSGVTIGRGYDLSQRSRGSILSDLIQAGMPTIDASFLASASGLKGEAAKAFLRRNQERLPLISLQAQQSLFQDVVAPQLVGDIKRIFSKPDLVARYGEAVWANLDRRAQELVFDLRYRGDYTPETRRVLQPLLVANDVDGLKATISNREYWKALGVPPDRIERRIGLMSEGGSTLPLLQVPLGAVATP